jgi:hypothetical protein
MNPPVLYRVNRPSVVYEAFDDEIVIINLDNGNYYSLDGAGGDIWSLIESGANVSEIVEGVVGRYEGSNSSDLESAVNQSIAELEEEDLIVPVEPKEDENRRALPKQIEAESETEKPVFKRPVLQKFTDMQDFLLVDPIHEVDYTDWPQEKE